ncbi:hypothetical protein [Thiohalocapsa sp. ML1]|jgi:hypothetical protein|uniref:hypothetical protein n=1 Tax=Thiohalocapsa sp. ML1 TaxID=1431688 RepID=UPI000731F76B|nr:hypothetical protein [Thiohalocapsa sp. ML1]
MMFPPSAYRAEPRLGPAACVVSVPPAVRAPSADAPSRDRALPPDAARNGESDQIAAVLGSHPATLADHSSATVAAPGVADRRALCLFENYIDGAWRRPAARRWLTTAPGSGAGGGSVARACARDVALACAAARGAAADWLRCGSAVRRAVLGQLPACIAEQAPTLVMARACDRAMDTEPPDPGWAADMALAVRDVVRGLRAGAAALVEPAVARRVWPAAAPERAVCRQLLPLLYEGRVVVVLLLYPDGRRLPVRLLQLLGIVGAALPAGVLNVLTGLGLEAGVALVERASASARTGPLRGPTSHGVDGGAVGLSFPVQT